LPLLWGPAFFNAAGCHRFHLDVGRPKQFACTFSLTG
jgi:hypothetical protein